MGSAALNQGLDPAEAFLDLKREPHTPHGTCARFGGTAPAIPRLILRRVQSTEQRSGVCRSSIGEVGAATATPLCKSGTSERSEQHEGEPPPCRTRSFFERRGHGNENITSPGLFTPRANGDRVTPWGGPERVAPPTPPPLLASKPCQKTEY